MMIGIGLPNAVPHVAAADLLRWAVMAGQSDFSCLATTDRIVYDSYDSLTMLAAAAAVCDMPLMTSVLVAPLRANTALLAKQAATVDRLCGGRLTLGLGVGARSDDFRAGGIAHERRGDLMDEQLRQLPGLWAGDRRGFAGGVGPAPHRTGGPRLVIGGQGTRAVERAAVHAEGWISGSGGPDMFLAGAESVRLAWQRQGRAGTPRLMALAYYALGDDADSVAASYLQDYYGFAPAYAEAVRSHAAVGRDSLTRLVDEFETAGCDELVLVPCSAALAQLDGAARWLANRT